MTGVTRTVVCAGLVTVDLVHVVAGPPSPDQKIVGLSQRIEVGGPAANAARVASALGLSARLIAPFGDSPLTGWVRSALTAEGVEWVDPVARQPNPSPMSSVMINAADGSRTVVSGGGPPHLGDSGHLAARCAEAVAGASAVLVDGHGGSLPAAAARAGRAHGIPVLLDGGSYKDGMESYLPDVDLALLSADFRAGDGGDPLAWCLGAGARVAAASGAAGPIRLLSGATESVVAVPAARRVVDTLGAGDVLHGATLAALASVPDPSTYAGILTFAAEVATASVEHAGALGWSADPVARDRARRALAVLG